MTHFIVLSCVPYESQTNEFICASKDTAEYLRDWLEAIEENRHFDLELKYSKPGRPWVGNKEFYVIEEHEVIL